MNILLVTQEYPADDVEKGFTPVVHFFAKEWVALGHTVHVINFPSNFPKIYYVLAKPFKEKLESFFGVNIRMYSIAPKEYRLDGVNVLRYPLSKKKPHGRFPIKEIRKGIKAAKYFCQSSSFIPDVIIGHWTNPVVEVMLGLKQCFNVPTALVMHDDGFDFRDIYSNERKEIFSKIDIWGWRSFPIKKGFERCFGEQKKNFMCFSGVPEQYIHKNINRNFKVVKNFLFVGLLIKRKHPFEYLKALEASDINDYTLDIVGQGDEKNSIENYIQCNKHLKEKIHLCGRISRNEVSKKMLQADVFCMISERETFGLVYIEAMAAGCITIASKNEGFDGIIVDGKNGFLCEAGNEKELTTIINKISMMSQNELSRISTNAIETAKRMTDRQVAKKYIDEIVRLMK